MARYRSVSDILRRIALLREETQSITIGSDRDRELRTLFDDLRGKSRSWDLNDDQINVISSIFSGTGLDPRTSHDYEALSYLIHVGILEGEIEAVDALRLTNFFLHGSDIAGDSRPYPEPFPSNRAYLTSWFQYIDDLYSSRRDGRADRRVHVLDDDFETCATATAQLSINGLRDQRRLLERRSRVTRVFLPLEHLAESINLTVDERVILLFLLNGELQNQTPEIQDIITLIARDQFDLSWERHFLPTSNLLAYELIEIETYRENLYRMRSDECLQSTVRKWILRGEDHIAGITDTCLNLLPYESSEGHLHDWLLYSTHLKRLASLSAQPFSASNDDPPSYMILNSVHTPHYAPYLDRIETRIAQKCSCSSIRLRFEEFVTEYALTPSERDVLIVLLDNDILDESTTVSKLAKVLRFRHLPVDVSAVLDQSAKLCASDLIDVAETRLGPIVGLNPSTKTRLLSQSNSLVASASDPARHDEFFTTYAPTQTLDDIVLPTSIIETLRMAVKRFESRADETLQCWGILPKRTASGSSLTFLFSGPSGVGKTYAAGALARSLGRDVLTTDISKILSLWVGQSQQNLVRVFDRYDAICRRSEIAPVLLLNECDQFFSQRSIDNGRSVDKMYHQMQNLFLERLESFEGVLIATTNLVESLDTAFSRRFDWKLEFERPSAEARLAIWRLHIPVTVPLADDVDLRRLADEFAFTGGQIAICVRNAASASAIRGDVLRMEDLLSACHAEENGAFGATGGNRSRKVGFSTTEQELSSQIH